MAGTKDGKKGKKSKSKPMPLGEFLGPKHVPEGFDKKVINWADAMDGDDELNGTP